MGEVRSNLEFINDKMDNLKVKISMASEACDNHHKVDSTKNNNLLYSKMNGMVDKYSSIQNELMKKLEHESEFIKTVGEKYYQLDKKMANEADKL